MQVATHLQVQVLVSPRSLEALILMIIKGRCFDLPRETDSATETWRVVGKPSSCNRMLVGKLPNGRVAKLVDAGYSRKFVYYESKIYVVSSNLTSPTRNLTVNLLSGLVISTADILLDPANRNII